MTNSVDPDQTAPIGAVCSGSTLFVSILNSTVMLGNYLQQTTSVDDLFRCICLLGVLRVNMQYNLPRRHLQCLSNVDLVWVMRFQNPLVYLVAHVLNYQPLFSYA